MKTTFTDGILTVYNRFDFTNLNEYEFVYWIEADGEKIQEAKMKLDVKPHEAAEIEIGYVAKICKYGMYLNAVLTKDGKTYAITQHELPCLIEEIREGEKAELTESGEFIYASGERFSYAFSKHYGVFTSLMVDGEEQLDGRTKLSALKAPTDNERNVKSFWLRINIWQGENLDYAFTKVYDCHIEDGMIVLEGSLAGVSRSPLMKHQLQIQILKDGRIDFKLNGKIRENAFWLPRLGFEFELPKTSNEFTYFGRGPIESYCDMCHWATVGMYDSNAEKEYVKYVRPQEHGNHNDVKMLRIGKLEFFAKKAFEMNVSEYATKMLCVAEHTDELEKDGKIHLRIDYKVSGLGSNSCGPELLEKYRLDEKEINFEFSVKPI